LPLLSDEEIVHSNERLTQMAQVLEVVTPQIEALVP
jgi:hypothetical protein